MPSVPSMTDADRPVAVRADSGQRPPIDRGAVQYLDRVRAIFRPASGSTPAPGVERFIGREEVFRHVGEGEMQCPSHWSDGSMRVPIGDLEILEILEDQDVRAG